MTEDMCECQHSEGENLIVYFVIQKVCVDNVLMYENINAVIK